LTKFAFGVHGVFGEEPKLEIQGVYLWRGTGVPQEMRDNPQFEYYNTRKLDHTKEEDKNLVAEFWGSNVGDVVNGLKCQERKYLK
jgi:elongation factor 1-gamma